MTARWKDWAYELPAFKRDYIAKRLDEFTRAREETECGAEAGDS